MGTNAPALVARAMGLGGVFDHTQLVATGDVEDGVQIGRLAVKVHGQDGTGARRNRGLDAGRVDALADRGVLAPGMKADIVFLVDIDGDEDEDEDEEDDESSDDLDDLAWEDVFDQKAQPAPDVSEDEAPRPKEKRMTTNKRKAENYYTHANVKNRNRQKQAAMSELHAQSRHRDRGSRVGANKKASRTSNPKLQKRK